MSSGIKTLCRYRIKPGKQEEFETLLNSHWPMLHREGLATDEPAQTFRAGDQAGNVAYIEIFCWAGPESAQTAHETPAVMQMWEPMGALCDDMEFWHISPVGE